MEPTPSQQLKIKSVKDCNNLQNKVVLEFNQEQDSTSKLISSLKNISYPLTVTCLLQINMLKMY